MIKDNTLNECNSMQNHRIVIPAQAGVQLINQSPRSGQSHVRGVVPLRGMNCFYLDSRLRGNDGYCKGICHGL